MATTRGLALGLNQSVAGTTSTGLQCAVSLLLAGSTVYVWCNMNELNPERRLLTCILLRPEILPVVRGLVKPSDFVDEDYRDLYAAALRAEVVTIHSIVSGLPTTQRRKASLVDLGVALCEERASGADWKHWVYRLVEVSLHRQLREYSADADYVNDFSNAVSGLNKLTSKVLRLLKITKGGLK